MANRLTYSSSEIDAATSRAYEEALAAARDNVPAPLTHVIGGRPVARGAVSHRHDPANAARLVAAAHTADSSVVGEAVAAARSAAKTWRGTGWPDRIGAVRSAAAHFRDRRVELAGTISAETGKTRLEALAEADEAADLIHTYCAQAEQSNGFATPLDTLSDSESNVDLLRPYGVFGVISPFNYPVALLVNMTVGALLTGNTVVLKPSDKTPRSSALAAGILSSVVPPGALNVVHGGDSTGAALAASDIDGIAFTGSAQVGWSLVRKLNAGRWGRPVLAEMGGKNPAVVMHSADLDAAAEGIVRSAFGLSGQKCSACSRVVVASPVHDDLIERIVERASVLTVADPVDPKASLGPVIDTAAFERLDAAVAQAAADGSLVAGGRRVPLPGHFFEPTVVTGLERGHRLTREEVFGPLLTVTAVSSMDEALEEANAADYGLTAGIFTRDEDEKQRFLDEIEAGVVYVNRRAGATTGAWPGIQSFCGWKASGSAGKGGLGPWYLTGFMREQSRTVVD